MNHPYSGAASYIYANDFIASGQPSLREPGPRVVNTSRNPVPGRFIYQDRSRKIYNYYHYSPEDRLKIDLHIKARQERQTQEHYPVTLSEKHDFLNRPLPPIPPNEGKGHAAYLGSINQTPSHRPSTSGHSHSNVNSGFTHARLPSVPHSLPDAPRTKRRFRIHLSLSPFRFSFHKRLTGRSDHKQHRDSLASRNSLSGWRWSKSLSMPTDGRNKTMGGKFRRWLSMNIRAPTFSESGQSRFIPRDAERSRMNETAGILRPYRGKERRKQGRKMKADNGEANFSTSIMSV